MTYASIYEEIEALTVERLKPLEVASDFVVMPQPENPKEFEKQFKVTRVTIMYDGERMENNGSGMELRSQSTEGAVQEETIHIKAVVESRKLRGIHGLYWAMFQMKKNLRGYQPAGADPMRLVDVKFSSYNENTWTYEMTWGTRIPGIPEMEEENEPLLKLTNFDEFYTTPS